MSYNSRTNFKVFNDYGNPLIITSFPSTSINYNFFTATVGTATALWTPSSGKSIYLTAIEISSSGLLSALTINLHRASDSIFATIGLTTTNSYNANYFSPIKFNTNEIISLTTSGLTTGTLYITLFGYEQ